MFPDLPAHHAATVDRARRGARLVVRGMALNAVLGLTKIAGGVIGDAYALVADGAESITDIAISVLVWAGFQWAARPPDKEHPYGHGKAEAVAGLITSLVVVGAGAGIGWHAFAEIRDPQHTPRWWTLLILAGVVAAKVVFSRRLNEVGRDTESTALGAEAWHHFSDAITSAAAFVGISIAVPAERVDEIRLIAARVPGVAGLEKCRVRKSGLSYLVDIHVQVNGGLSVREGHRIAHAVKDSLLSSRLRVTDVAVHVEPV